MGTLEPPYLQSPFFVERLLIQDFQRLEKLSAIPFIDQNYRQFKQDYCYSSIQTPTQLS